MNETTISPGPGNYKHYSIFGLVWSLTTLYHSSMNYQDRANKTREKWVHKFNPNFVNYQNFLKMENKEGSL